MIHDRKNANNFFCPAKWDELYLYLNHGLSNSCSHPIPHEISSDDLALNPAALHNTRHKLEMQSTMLAGGRPHECHMCWHIEDSNPNARSDRFLKLDRWGHDSSKYSINPRHVPRMIEVVFDNLCNMSCSYCDSGQSSTWAKVLRTQGPFDLETDHRHLYQKIHIEPGSTKQEYLDAWNAWWPQIKEKVKILKVSGGEPLTSPNFWNTADAIANDHLDLTFRINSNLNVDRRYLERLASLQHNIHEIGIAASIDATGPIAEFTRMGLDYDLFLDNMHWWCRETNDNCKLNLQSTVNFLGIWGLRDKLQLCVDIRSSYGSKITDLYSTIVRFPEFQNILILPRRFREDLSSELQDWLSSNGNALTEYETVLVNKTINYLVDEPEPMIQHDRERLLRDMVKFVERYSRMSKHDIRKIYPREFIDWLNDPK